MRRLNEFSGREWLALVPLVQGLREVRNDALLAHYTGARAEGLQDFLSRHASLRGRRVAVTIAFEQPWALDWQLAMARRHLPHIAFVVFDNSRSPRAREAIGDVCARHDVPCLALPAYRTHHANRSHGMAMSWVYRRVLRALAPEAFVFLDHDLIPLPGADPFRHLESQPVYGLLNEGVRGCWNLWAGYCAFRFAALEGTQGNFLYDFSRGLDTGGRNWDEVYSRLDRRRLQFAPRRFETRTMDGVGSREVEIVDGGWVHIGGIGYGTNFADKFAFFEAMRLAPE
jgi:hypothetical protein